MKCSLCNSENTNKLTCPLNKNSKRKDYKKHYNCKKHTEQKNANKSKNVKNAYFKNKNNDKQLNDIQKKYCRCVLHVMNNNNNNCLKNKNWDSNNKCYNPYSVCSKSVGTSTGSKSCQYNMDTIPIDELRKYITYNETKFKLFLRENKKTMLILKDEKLLRKYALKWYNSK